MQAELSRQESSEMAQDCCLWGCVESETPAKSLPASIQGSCDGIYMFKAMVLLWETHSWNFLDVIKGGQKQEIQVARIEWFRGNGPKICRDWCA